MMSDMKNITYQREGSSRALIKPHEPLTESRGSSILGAKHQIRGLGDVAYEALHDAILSGRLRPKQRISVRTISEELGISPTPVKEALRRLTFEGFITIHPRRGTYVADSLEASHYELCLIRASLEGVAARLAAQKATEAHLRALSDQLETMHSYTISDYQVDRLYEANSRFHQLIYDASGNPYIAQLLSSLRIVTAAIRRRALADPAEARTGLQEHRAIFEAIGAHDGELAEDRVRAHIMRTIKDVSHVSNRAGSRKQQASR
jgi:DNA-binding GntR family transcriptional regulator